MSREGRCPKCDKPMYALDSNWYCPNEACQPGGLLIPYPVAEPIKRRRRGRKGGTV